VRLKPEKEEFRFLLAVAGEDPQNGVRSFFAQASIV
jgi:hypothetical protein